MKSIVEQAATVLKAIEKGWIQAGKPSEFTVKVYEEGVKNFFGISVEPAKICILFEDKQIKTANQKQQHSRHDTHTNHQTQHTSHNAPSRKDTLPSDQRKKNVPSASLPQHIRQQKGVMNIPSPKKEIGDHVAQPVSTKIIWSDELVDTCKDWLTTTLAVMGKEACVFTVETKKYHLIFKFSQPVLEDKELEKTLFRSFAHLLMQSLRNRFKKGLRGYRIIFNAE